MPPEREPGLRGPAAVRRGEEALVEQRQPRVPVRVRGVGGGPEGAEVGDGGGLGGGRGEVGDGEEREERGEDGPDDLGKSGAELEPAEPYGEVVVWGCG